jgi:hypothetical protein
VLEDVAVPAPEDTAGGDKPAEEPATDA